MIYWKVILMKYLLVFSLIVSAAGSGSLAADGQPVSADARLNPVSQTEPASIFKGE